MKNKVELPVRYLQAIRLFAPKDDVRNYLKGVALTRGYVAATNDHCVGAIRCDKDMLDPALPEVIIPAQALDFFFKKAKGFTSYADVTIEWEAGQAIQHITTGKLTCGSAEELFRAEEGVFPSFERVIPDVTRPEGHPQFQWSWLTVFEKAAVALGVPSKNVFKVHLLPNGTSSNARVTIPGHPEFNGAVAPISPSQFAEWAEYLDAESLV